jgi:hypothetical protein
VQSGPVSVELCESRQSQNSSLSETFVHCEMVAVGDADDRTAAERSIACAAVRRDAASAVAPAAPGPRGRVRPISR